MEKCPYCPETFPDEYELERHFIQVHPEKRTQLDLETIEKMFTRQERKDIVISAAEIAGQLVDSGPGAVEQWKTAFKDVLKEIESALNESGSNITSLLQQAGLKLGE